MKEALKKITPLYNLYILLLRVKNKLYNYLFIPNYETKRKTIIAIAKSYNYSEVFLETGTFMGDTVDYLKNYFHRLISIELNQQLASKAQKRFIGEDRIQIIQGDSAQQLSLILSSINSSVVFWLDGHYSSEFQAGDEYIVTGKGEKDTPIMEELLQIAQHPNKNHLILIDDARLFNGQNDYPTKEQLSDFIKQKLPGYRFLIKNDIIRILPNK